VIPLTTAATRFAASRTVLTCDFSERILVVDDARIVRKNNDVC